MLRIDGHLDVRIQGDGFKAKLLNPLTYHIDGRRIYVEAGWVTDWASIPRFFHRVFPPMGPHTWAAILHDYLYLRRKGKRLMADRLFLAVMRDCGVSWWQRTAMYTAVRLFGWRAWDNA